MASNWLTTAPRTGAPGLEPTDRERLEGRGSGPQDALLALTVELKKLKPQAERAARVDRCALAGLGCKQRTRQAIQGLGLDPQVLRYPRPATEAEL